MTILEARDFSHERFTSCIEEVKGNSDKYKEAIYQRILKYAPVEHFKDCSYYFYAGGYDLGFSEKPGEVYINIHANIAEYP